MALSSTLSLHHATYFVCIVYPPFELSLSSLQNSIDMGPKMHTYLSCLLLWKDDAYT